MTDIGDILRPKSKKEVVEEIRKMDTFEFVNSFQRMSIKGMKVGFKKQMAHVFISPKSHLRKYILRSYWICWFTWLMLYIFCMVFPPGIFGTGPVDIIKDIFWYYITGFIFFWLPALITMRKYTKWKRKNTKFNFIIPQNINIWLDTQQLLDQANRIINEAERIIENETSEE